MKSSPRGIGGRLTVVIVMEVPTSLWLVRRRVQDGAPSSPKKAYKLIKKMLVFLSGPRRDTPCGMKRAHVGTGIRKRSDPCKDESSGTSLAFENQRFHVSLTAVNFPRAKQYK